MKLIKKVIAPSLFLFSTLCSMDDSDIFAHDTAKVPSIAQFIAQILSSPFEIVQLLKSIEAFSILQENFYLHTNTINKRNIIDLPIFEPSQYSYKGNWLVGLNFFYNETFEAHYVKDLDGEETHISSYLALTEPTLLEALETSFQQLKELLGDQTSNLDIRKIFSLMQNMKIQERRVGLMFQTQYASNKIHARCMVPFYYLERNFFLNNDELDAIGAEFGEASPEFQKNHAISDAIGFGDTRLEIDSPLVKNYMLSARIGIQSTIPTAFALENGMMGRSFPKPCSYPLFDFDEVFDLVNIFFDPNQNQATKDLARQQTFNILSNFILGASDRIAANLIDTRLGNEGHFGLGLYARTKVRFKSFFDTTWARGLVFKNRLSLEYLFPRTQKRFFVTQNNPQDFANRNFDDPNQAVANLTFLEQELVNKAYLIARETRVQPNVILRSTSGLYYKGTFWSAHIGSDFWLQGREHIQTINGKPDFVDTLDRNRAKSFLAYQSKIFGGISYKHHSADHDWYISLVADATWLSSGIGKDMSIALSFEKNF